MEVSAAVHRVPPSALRNLYRHTWHHNLKIPLFYGIMMVCGWLAWQSPNVAVRWGAYACIGYLWMSIVTFMHDATHNVLFKKRWKNWAFGLFSTLPIFVTFVAFKEDHLEHHRHNRSPSDPDAFTMGDRTPVDFLLFYSYMALGVVLTVVQFNFIYPFRQFRGRRLRIHLAELFARIALYSSVLAWAAHAEVLEKVLALWLVPAVIFSFLNSMRFVAEHYGTPWDAGPLLGTRTVLSNRVNRFFWNNINYHIGHHLYPGVPWYNLERLHSELLPIYEAEEAIVDSGYLSVFWSAFLSGPETELRNEEQLARRIFEVDDRITGVVQNESDAAAVEELEQASHAFSKTIYEKAGAAGAAEGASPEAAAGGRSADEAAGASGDDDAIDAEFEVKDA